LLVFAFLLCNNPFVGKKKLVNIFNISYCSGSSSYKIEVLQAVRIRIWVLSTDFVLHFSFTCKADIFYDFAAGKRTCKYKWKETISCSKLQWHGGIVFSNFYFGFLFSNLSILYCP